MIPHTLHIKNFLSYGSEIQVIDFSPHQLICLSGKNGHGKSALLDAITWSLWGQARKTSGTSKADDGLLHLGQTQMMVILDFEFNGTLYRAKREYAKTYGKPLTTLEFGVLNPATNTISSLTDKTGRATQDIIDTTLNLDYETFVNSAFLRQGQANEFSKKSPKERKQVLATILGLDRYENLRRRALDKIKTFLNRKQALELFHEKMTQEIAQKEALEIAHKKSDDSLAALSADMSLQEEALRDTEAREKSIEVSLNQRRIVEFEYNQKLTAWDSLVLDLHNLRNAWRNGRNFNILITDKKDLEVAYQSLAEQLSIHQHKLSRTLELKEQSLQLQESSQKQLLDDANHFQKNSILQERLRGMIEHYEKELAICRIHKNQVESEQKIISHDMDALKTIIDSYQQARPLHSTIKKQFDKRKAFYQKLIALGNILSNQKSQLAQKDALVCNEENPSCPLCEQSVSVSRRRFLRNTFSQEQNTLTHRLARISSLIHTLKNLLYSQHEVIVGLQQAEVEHSKHDYSHTELHKKIQDLDKQSIELAQRYTQLTSAITEAKKEMSSLQSTAIYTKEMSSHTHLPGLSAALEEVKKQIIAIAYQPSAHKLVQEKLTDIENQRKQWDSFQKTALEQKTRADRIHELCITLKSLKIHRQALKEELAKTAFFINEYEALRIKKSSCLNTLTNLRNQKELLLQESTRLKTELAKIRDQEAQLALHLEEIKTIDTTIEDYQIIATAASKDGIQALLIEDAIPEIEQEANDLLIKLTNNQAQLFIESLRDLKKGGTKETLDIKISDPAGIRPYELFSGGEAFRIDFAIRVAISKLLARRAGTPLQTLIIDEGFGSQDEEGLHLIMDALHKIQDSFHKIIIVSHLDALKDQFPVHFVVQKYPSGSRVEVIHNG